MKRWKQSCLEKEMSWNEKQKKENKQLFCFRQSKFLLEIEVLKDSRNGNELIIGENETEKTVK